MTDQIERHLREVFSEDADQAPVAGPLADRVVMRVRRQRRYRLACAASVSLAGMGAAAVFGGGLGGLTTSVETPVAASPGTTSVRHGIVPDSSLTDCMAANSPAAIAARTFSFDGTVLAISSGPTDQTVPRYAAVTFTVNQWFRGDSGDTVTVNMMAPLAAGEVFSESGPSYGVGTRLLVSGEPRSGQSDLSGALAWGCGYTRYYDQQTADSWRAAITGS